MKHNSEPEVQSQEGFESGLHIFFSAIRQMRKTEGLTQTQCAEKVGVSLRTWISWEKGDSAPEFAKLGRIAELFGVQVYQLFCNLSYDAMKPPAGTPEAFLVSDGPPPNISWGYRADRGDDVQKALADLKAAEEIARRARQRLEELLG